MGAGMLLAILNCKWIMFSKRLCEIFISHFLFPSLFLVGGLLSFFDDESNVFFKKANAMDLPNQMIGKKMFPF